MKSPKHAPATVSKTEISGRDIKKYVEFPVQTGDAGSALYCLNRKNSQILEFFRAELWLMRKLLSTCPLLKTLSEKRAVAQLIAKQLAFLGMQKDKLSLVVQEYDRQLSEALRKGTAGKLAELNREVEKLSRDIREFSMQFLMVKVAIYQVMKKFTGTGERGLEGTTKTYRD